MFGLCSDACRSRCALGQFSRHAAAREALTEAGGEPWAVRTLGPFAAAHGPIAEEPWSVRTLGPFAGARSVTPLRQRRRLSRATPLAASKGRCHLPLGGKDRGGPALTVGT